MLTKIRKNELICLKHVLSHDQSGPKLKMVGNMLILLACPFIGK